jgi:hypothetical protein
MFQADAGDKAADLYNVLLTMEDFEASIEEPIRRAGFLQGFMAAINLVSAGIR